MLESILSRRRSIRLLSVRVWCMALGCGLMLVAMSQLQALAAQPLITLRLSHMQHVGNIIDLQSVKFKESVERLTDGKIAVIVFPDSQLGDAKASIEGMRMGTLDMLYTSSTPLVSLDPLVGAFDLPFLFRDDLHAAKVMDGPVADEINARLQKKGLRILAYGSSGWREMTNNVRPIRRPEDLTGLKMRTMESRVEVATFKALGANPSPISYAALYTTLAQGVIDGQDAPVTQVLDDKLYEVQKYLTLNDFQYGIVAGIMAESTWNKIPAELQPKVMQAAAEARDYSRKLGVSLSAQAVSKLKAIGMQVISVEDKTPWQNAVKSAFEELKADYSPEFVNKIRSVK